MPILAHPGDAFFQAVEAGDLTTKRDHVGTLARLEEARCHRGPAAGRRRRSRPAKHPAAQCRASACGRVPPGVAHVASPGSRSPSRSGRGLQRPPERLGRRLLDFGEPVRLGIPRRAGWATGSRPATSRSSPSTAAQLRQADQQTRPGDMAGLDGIAQTGIGTPRVPHRGDTQLQGPAQLRHRLQQPVRRRAVAVLRAGESHMSVAVDQAGKQGQAGAVNPLIAIKTYRDFYDAPVSTVMSAALTELPWASRTVPPCSSVLMRAVFRRSPGALNFQTAWITPRGHRRLSPAPSVCGGMPTRARLISIVRSLSRPVSASWCGWVASVGQRSGGCAGAGAPPPPRDAGARGGMPVRALVRRLRRPAHHPFRAETTDNSSATPVIGHIGGSARGY